MPRAGDRFPDQRGLNDLNSPLRGLLDFSSGSAISMTARAAGGVIGSAITGGLNTVVGVIKQLTGIDLSSWATFIEGFFGATNIDLSAVGSLNPATSIANLFKAFQGIDITNPGSVLAAIESGVVDVASLVEQGVLTTTSQLPAWLLAQIMPGASASTNIVPDPFFTAASNILGGVFSWSASAPPGAPSNAGSAQVTADGTLLELRSIPLPVPLNQANFDIPAELQVIWSGVTAAAGNAFAFTIESFSGLDALGNVIGPALTADPGQAGGVTNPLVGAIANPAAAGGWATITGQYQPPPGTQWAVIVMQVLSNVSAGTIKFSALKLDFPSLIDAAKITNLENIGEIAASSIAGALGITTLPATWQHLLDGAGTANTIGGTVAGIGFADLFHLLGQTAQNASDALGFGVGNKQVLETTTNKAINNGLEHTAEATFRLTEFPHGATLPTISVAAGTAIGGFINTAQTVTKGFFEFMPFGTGVTSIFGNVYLVDKTTGARTRLWSSPDLSASVTTAAAFLQYIIPLASQMAVAAASLLHLEIANAGSAAITVAYKQNPTPNRPGLFGNFGMTRTLSSTGGTSPASLTNGQVTYGQNIPYISLGVANVPASYQPPDIHRFTTPGTYSVSAPSWFRSGVDFVDGVGIGGGGEGGAGQFGGGTNGSPTTITLHDGTVLIDAPGSAGGPGGYDNNGAHSVGWGAATFEYNGASYPGGGDVGAQTVGTSPGGGGGSGYYYGLYGYGAQAAIWAGATRQPTSAQLPIAVVVGAGGPYGGMQTPGGNGGPGEAVVTFRRNTAVA